MKFLRLKLRTALQLAVGSAYKKHVILTQACLLLCSTVLPPAFAQSGAMPAAAASAATAPAGSARELYQKGQFEAAGAQGLTELLSEPWNHELRFLVADSLQRSGKPEEAASQFEALEGTPYAASASLRMNALRPSQPPRQLMAPAPVRRVEVAQAAPQYQYAAPDLTQARPVAREVEPRRSVYTLIERPALEVAAAPLRSPGQQEIYDLNTDENYKAVGTRGLALFARETPSDELRLMVANSLAWTGRLKEAIEQYQLLTKGPLASDAMVGLANVYRWRGRDDQAVPLYQTVLAKDPQNAGALEGLGLANRELHPRTLITAGASSDSQDMQRRQVAVNQRWRDGSGQHVFEVETSGVNDKLGTLEERQRDVKLRYQALGVPLQPRVELEVEAKPDRNVYGGVKVKLGERQIFVSVDRVNWGKLASNPKALQANLSATHVGVEASGSFQAGDLSSRIDYYSVSDGNAVTTKSINFTPFWRPLGSHVKQFIGVETRDVSFQTSNYWSPAGGFGTLYTGLMAEWGGADWNYFASGQIGTRLYGEASTNWSVSTGGRLWVARDVAVGLNLWSMSSARDGAPYKSKAANLSLEKIWN
jgi:tetratricopeptide (TPR) repeat protein